MAGVGDVFARTADPEPSGRNRSQDVLRTGGGVHCPPLRAWPLAAGGVRATPAQARLGAASRGCTGGCPREPWPRGSSVTAASAARCVLWEPRAGHGGSTEAQGHSLLEETLRQGRTVERGCHPAPQLCCL